MLNKIIYLLVLLFVILFINNSFARDEIRIVGSSTVYPFSSLISEKFAIKTKNVAPIVESTGTGGGFAIFCQGVGFNYPDINDASRQIKSSELNNCEKNGIKEPLEIKIGYDGIVIIIPKYLKSVNLTKEQIFLALAAKVPSQNNKSIWVPNYYKKWNEISPSLPNIPIKILGPPSTSGTRDSFIELVMNEGCKKFLTKNMSNTKELCGRLRYDGTWIDAGENDSLILQKVMKSKELFAIMGYSYFSKNVNSVNVVSINNISPNTYNIKNHKYPLIRPLFMYVKKEHIENITGLKDFIQEIISKNTMSSNGYLMNKGLIPLSSSEYKTVVSNVQKTLNSE